MDIHTIQKKSVTDEKIYPLDVSTNHQNWFETDRLLTLDGNEQKMVDLSCFNGRIILDEDPLEYQRRVRDEWP